ncbi:MAG: Fe-S cluster assembly ATPase SufC [Candidatus Babeliales bacterium]
MEISSLSVTIQEKLVLEDINLVVQPGTVHALLGPNGSGKSSLALTLIGHPQYQAIKGSVVINNQNILDLSVEKRARLGLFLAFQHPMLVQGVTVLQFLHEAYRALCNSDSTIGDFYAQLIEAMDLLEIPYEFAERHVHDGFSGGQKKKLELLQLLVLKPKIAILDELDSGLDVDAIKVVTRALHIVREQNPTMALICITHYQPFLETLSPDVVHILKQGKIVCAGNVSLLSIIKERGYDAIG